MNTSGRASTEVELIDRFSYKAWKAVHISIETRLDPTSSTHTA
jgi:hypothetical protein